MVLLYSICWETSLLCLSSKMMDGDSSFESREVLRHKRVSKWRNESYFLILYFDQVVAFWREVCWDFGCLHSFPSLCQISVYGLWSCWALEKCYTLILQCYIADVFYMKRMDSNTVSHVQKKITFCFLVGPPVTSCRSFSFLNTYFTRRLLWSRLSWC